MSDVEIVCQVVRDRPQDAAIAVADGTTERDPSRLEGERLKWFFIPRSKIVDCEPPLDALPTSGPKLVTLTIPEWLALDRGLI